jgi:hypothetical protein
MDTKHAPATPLPQYHDHTGTRQMEEIANYAACDPENVRLADALAAKRTDA